MSKHILIAEDEIAEMAATILAECDEQEGYTQRDAEIAVRRWLRDQFDGWLYAPFETIGRNLTIDRICDLCEQEAEPNSIFCKAHRAAEDQLV